MHEHAEIRADRDLLEMATPLRVLDDAENLKDYYKDTKRPPLGEVIQGDGMRTAFHDEQDHALRATERQLSTDDPRIILHANRPKRWQVAEIRLPS